jgi:hypothetical protein
VSTSAARIPPTACKPWQRPAEPRTDVVSMLEPAANSIVDWCAPAASCCAFRPSQCVTSSAQPEIVLAETLRRGDPQPYTSAAFQVPQLENRHIHNTRPELYRAARPIDQEGQSGGWEDLAIKRRVRRNVRRPADDETDAGIESHSEKSNFDVMIARDDAVGPSPLARQTDSPPRVGGAMRMAILHGSKIFPRIRPTLPKPRMKR